jgi:hypothetical protein
VELDHVIEKNEIHLQANTNLLGQDSDANIDVGAILGVEIACTRPSTRGSHDQQHHENEATHCPGV